MESVELRRKPPPLLTAIGGNGNATAVPIRFCTHPGTEGEARRCVGGNAVFLCGQMGVDVVGVLRGQVHGGSVLSRMEDTGAVARRVLRGPDFPAIGPGAFNDPARRRRH